MNFTKSRKIIFFTAVLSTLIFLFVLISYSKPNKNEKSESAVMSPNSDNQAQNSISIKVKKLPALPNKPYPIKYPLTSSLDGIDFEINTFDPLYNPNNQNINLLFLNVSNYSMSFSVSSESNTVAGGGITYSGGKIDANNYETTALLSNTSNTLTFYSLQADLSFDPGGNVYYLNFTTYLKIAK